MTAESTPPERPTTTRCLVWAVIALIVFLCAGHLVRACRTHSDTEGIYPVVLGIGCYRPKAEVASFEKQTVRSVKLRGAEPASQRRVPLERLVRRVYLRSQMEYEP